MVRGRQGKGLRDITTGDGKLSDAEGQAERQSSVQHPEDSALDRLSGRKRFEVRAKLWEIQDTAGRTRLGIMHRLGTRK